MKIDRVDVKSPKAIAAAIARELPKSTPPGCPQPAIDPRTAKPVGK